MPKYNSLSKEKQRRVRSYLHKKINILNEGRFKLRDRARKVELSSGEAFAIDTHLLRIEHAIDVWLDRLAAMELLNATVTVPRESDIEKLQNAINKVRKITAANKTAKQIMKAVTDGVGNLPKPKT